MAQRYEIRKNDTLAKIAKRFYSDAALFQKLALYNGIQDANRIILGQVIEIPSRKELLGGTAVPTAQTTAVAVRAVATSGAAAAPAPILQPPNGLEEVLATFGDINKFIAADGSITSAWESQFITRVPLPFPIPLSWNLSAQATQIRCHKLLAGVFEQAFQTIDAQELRQQIQTYGGCYEFRAKRTSAKISAHAWGIALDLNPLTNAQATLGNMHPGVVNIFRSFGFKWGGDWTGKSKDPMHFQFCTGY